jgi:hypothetical protein
MDQFSNHFRYDEARSQLVRPEENEYAKVDIENFDFEAFLQSTDPLVALPYETSNAPAGLNGNEYEDLFGNLPEDPQEQQLQYDKIFSSHDSKPLEVPSRPINNPGQQEFAENWTPINDVPQPKPARAWVPVELPAEPWMQTDLEFAQRPSQQAEGMQFRNVILNSFQSPIVPLRIIDEMEFPFSSRLHQALRRELALQPECDLESPREPQLVVPAPRRQVPAAAAPVMPVAMLASSPTTAGFSKKPGNKRPDNIKNFDPTEFYEALPAPPASWGTDPETGERDFFKYNRFGELDPNATFTVRQMQDYLAMHPLHGFTAPKQSSLTIWIQVTPADSGRRYGTKNSDKCRFECCPDPLRTIRKGDFRVAFDEQFATRRGTDPFHCAGFVHLYCLEKFFDFPQMCKEFNVKPDTRKLREGKNKMAITRDHSSMGDIVLDFITESKPWRFFGEDGMRPEQYYEYTLCYLLTVEHLAKQPKHLQKVREQRGGNTIDVHLNNLEVYLKNRKDMERKVRTQEKKKKRKFEDPEDDVEFQIDDDILEKPVSLRPRRKHRRNS